MAKFTENDIRPLEFEEQKIQAHQDDLKKFLEHKDQFVETACIVCQSKSSHFEYSKYSCQFVKCDNCQMVYMNPRPTEEFLNDFYTHSKLYSFWNQFIFPASAEVRRNKIFKPRVDRIIELTQKHNIENNTIIEAGAGFGLFCDEMNKSKKFNRVIAVEPGKDLSLNCQKLNIETLNIGIEEIDTKKYSADVIASFEVIEHLFDPNVFLKACYQILNPQGLLVLSCPNYEGFDIQQLGVISDSLDNEHMNMFSPKTLSQLLENHHFEILEYQTPGELDAKIVRDKVLNQSIEIEDPFLKKILVEEWDSLGGPFQEFLKDQKLSSHLWIVAQKT